MRKLGGWFASAKAELRPEDWPMVVRFRDLNDPKSVEEVDPRRKRLRAGDHRGEGLRVRKHSLRRACVDARR